MPARKATDATHELPPPPAPTARDANPWTVETAPGSVSRRHRFRRRTTGAAQDPVRRRSGPSRFAVAIAIAFLMLGIIFMRASEGAEFEDLAGVVFAMVVLILFAATRRRDRSRSAPRHEDRESG